VINSLRGFFKGFNMPIQRTLALQIAFALVFVSVFSLSVHAQAPAAPTGETSTAADSEFNAAVEDYKQAIRALESLRAEYQDADEATRESINAKLQQVVADTKAKVDRMTAAALESYKAAPNANTEVAELLVAMAQHLSVGQKPARATGGDYLGGDQPYEALAIITALLEGGHPEPRLAAWGGVCAVCTNDYPLAEKLLNQANDAGVFAELPRFPAQDTPADVGFLMKGRDNLANIEQLKAWWTEEQAIRAAESAANDLPRVKFTTTKGDIVIELFENQAPIATANMVNLVKEGFYSGVVFHRVLPHFMAQGGDPTGTGSGGPGHNIKCECYRPDARKHFRGTLSMAHAGRDTGGSQFFMCFVPTDFLNGRHTAFGRVVEGDDVLGKLQRIDPQAKGPFPTPDKIIKAEVIRDRGHAYEFEKLPGR